MDLNNIEYITYVGYDAICDALLTISHVFKNSGYTGLIYVAAVVGISLGLFTFFAKRVSGVEVSPLAMLLPIISGCVIYVALFIPKTTITVYEESTGKFQSFDGIPLGIGVMAGVINKIETGLVDVFDTSSLYKDTAGGRGLVGILTMKGMTTYANPPLDMSLNRYIEDCVTVELSRPDSKASFYKLRKGDVSFYEFFKAAANPALYTISYLNATAEGGDTVSCQEAFSRIIGAVGNPATWDNLKKDVCKQLGYSDLALNNCSTMLATYLGYIEIGSYGSTIADLNDFITKISYASLLNRYIMAGNLIPYTNYEIGVRESSVAVTLSLWIPYIKAVLTALSFSLTPLILIFLPTPLFGRALSLMFGLFLWILFWSITDAITHNAVGTMIYNAFEPYRNGIGSSGGPGLDAIVSMDSSAAKMFAMLNYVRGGAIMLATVFTGILVKFGGYALTSFAGNIMSGIEGAAVKGGKDVYHAVGSGQALKSIEGAAAYHRYAASHGFEERVYAAMGNLNRGFVSGIAAKDAIETHGLGAYTKSAINREHNQVGTGLGYVDKGTAFTTGVTHGQVSVGTADAYQNTGDPRESARIHTSLGPAPLSSHFLTRTGQAFISHRDPKSGLTIYTSGSQGLYFSGDMLTDVRGAHFSANRSDSIGAAFSTARSNLSSEVARFDQSTGESLTKTIMNSRGYTSLNAIANKFSTSSGASKEISNALFNTASAIAEKATSIKDSKGNEIDKEAFAQMMAGVRAGTPFGAISPIQVSVTGQGGYSVYVRTKEGTDQTYVVSVSNKEGTEKRIGEVWRESMQKLKSKDLSASDQKTLQELLQFTKTENSVEQASHAWSKMKSLEAKESEMKESAVSGKSNLDTAFVQWYADKYYSNYDPHARVREAFADLNQMVNSGQLGRVDNLFKEFVNDTAITPTIAGVRGNSSAVEAPSNPPVNLDNINDKHRETEKRLEEGRRNIEKPKNKEIVDHVRGDIEKANPTSDKPIERPKETNEKVDNLRTSINNAGEAMKGQEPWSLLYKVPRAEDLRNRDTVNYDRAHTLLGDTFDFLSYGFPHTPSDWEVRRFNEGMNNQYWTKEGAGKPQTGYSPKTPK